MHHFVVGRFDDVFLVLIDNFPVPNLQVMLVDQTTAQHSKSIESNTLIEEEVFFHGFSLTLARLIDASIDLVD